MAKGEKRNTKRMSQVAAVYTIAPFIRDAGHVIDDFKPRAGEAPRPKRPAPEGKRVWASLEGLGCDHAFMQGARVSLGGNRGGRPDQVP